MSSGARQSDGSFSGRVYRTRGPAFDATPFLPITPTDITDAGSMRLRFSDATNGTLQLTLSGQAAVEKPIARQVFSTPAAGCRG
jgi:hypothetical protein